MLTPGYTHQFEQDLKLMLKRGKDMEKLKILNRALVAEEKIDPIHQEHKLIGNWKGRRECLRIPRLRRTRLPYRCNGPPSLIWTAVM
jgi:addiction module RelE/StbE family toxin